MRLKTALFFLTAIALLLFSFASASASLQENEGEAQALAAEIQDTYGITVLYGNTCNEIETFGFDLGDTPMGRSPLLKLLGQCNYAEELQLISSCLELYPADIFQKLTCEEAPLGLRILLVNRLLADGASPAGATTIQDDYYNVFLGAGAFNSVNVHHELWHAMDYRITFEFPEAFSVWNDLNPPGFAYDSALLSEDIWALAQPRDEWFVRNYSVISEMEDRATVIEAAFQYDTAWWNDHPQIQRKLDAILDAAQPIFGDLKIYVSREE